MWTVKVTFLLIQILVLHSVQLTPILLPITSPTINSTRGLTNPISKTSCCPCTNFSQKYVNKTKPSAVQMEINIFRLPQSVVPMQYNLTIKIDFIKFQKNRYDEMVGNVSVKVIVKNRTRSIFLHCGENIAVRTIIVRSTKKGNSTRNLIKAFVNSFGVINITTLTDLLENEKYFIDIFNFSVKYQINQDSGMLSRTYETSNGTYEHILATQLEPESARLIFPCFDEPSFKSIFIVKITTNANYNILANSPEIDCQQTKLWKTCIFEPTPTMSTYNLAFSINNFEYVEHIDTKNVRFRIWARESQINNSIIALNYTVKILKIFEQMFKFNFPMRKIDSLAIPNLKMFLGMEHFGLITYDESILIQNPKFPLTFSRQLCVIIICHELSHQWFGNIVTTAWWSDLWLNEGFATYYSYRVANKILKSTEFYDIEKLTMINYLKYMDDYYAFPKGTINFPVSERAESKFDYLSYKKGFIIIGMIEQIMNVTSFDRSMIHYINENQYGSVYPGHLWKSLNRFSSHNLEIIMENWISKFCYPIVTVSIIKNVTLKLVQKSSFNADKNNGQLPSKEYVTNNWNLPLFVMYGNISFQSGISLVFFKELNGSIVIPNFNASNHWIVLNSNYIALQTTDYDDIIIDRLISTLLKNHTVIPPLSRAHILQDYYDSSKKFQRNNFKRLFKLLSYVEKEIDTVPLITALNIIDKLNGLFELRTFYLSWYKFIGTILKPSFTKLFKDFNDHFTAKNTTEVNLRRMLLNLACKLKLSYCQMISNVIIERWKNESLLNSDFDLLHIALCQFIQQDELGYNWISVYKSKMFQSWDFIGTKYYAMGCSKVSWVIEKNIDIVFNVLQMQNDRQNFPHVSSIAIDDIPADHLQAITPLGNILILSATYNNPNFQTVLIRFTRIGLHLLCNSIIFEPHFPIPKSIIEYAIPTLSHYNFIKQIYNYNGQTRDALLIDAKVNIEWMKKIDNLETYLSEYGSELNL